MPHSLQARKKSRQEQKVSMLAKPFFGEMIIAAVVWPTAGAGAKKGLSAIGLPAGYIPTAVAAFVIEAAMSSLASLR